MVRLSHLICFLELLIEAPNGSKDKSRSQLRFKILEHAHHEFCLTFDLSVNKCDVWYRRTKHDFGDLILDL